MNPSGDSYFKHRTKMHIDKLVQICQGNPGAVMAAVEMIKVSEETLEKIVSYGIVGTDLYVLFNDLCYSDPFQVISLVDKCPQDVLVDACSRQDRSGRKLVAEYLPIE